MAIPTFIQKSRINQVIYQIRGDHLEVSARSLVGKFNDFRIDLKSLDPEYEPRITRSYLLLLVPLGLALLSALILWAGYNQTLIPAEASIYLLQWPAVTLAVCLALAIRGSRRIEYYQFKNRAGRAVLAIIREPEQADECAAFIVALVAHIEAARAEVTEEQRRLMLNGTEANDPPTPPAASRASLWKFSVASGAAAAGLPWVSPLDDFMLIFPLCTGGIALSLFSFINKEPNRWWSVPGAILATIPLFYPYY